MRIISGNYRRRTLKTLKSGKLRPTTDQLRETIFDVIGPGIEGATFLDAYAGTGAVGIEALSRGAADVIFIEHHKPAAELIRENLRSLGVETGFDVMTTTVIRGIEKLGEAGETFDFVFLDPPYEEIREYHHVLRELGRSTLLTPQSLVIVEHSRHCELEERYSSLARTRLLRRGDAQLGFYRRSDPVS